MGLTITVEPVVSEHPLESTTITVYRIVDEGEDWTIASPVEDNP
jgi:hypothetical protein